MSLRGRVVTAVALVALVLASVLVVIQRSTESNLVDQVDEQLVDALPVVRRVGLGPGPGERRPPVGGPALSSLYVGVVRPDGVSTLLSPGLRGEALAPPVIEPARAVEAATSGAPFTVGAEGSDLRWRVLADPGRVGSVVTVIGLPLDRVDEAVGDLVVLELVAAAAIFVALALVAWWVIRLGIRPVNEMTEVAAAIAGGDLTQRVEDPDPGTEAGRLGIALNGMLASIEASFAERQRTEGRLRQFVADASHELRTPVATIRGYAELYRSGALDDDERLADAMRRTEQEAIRMGGLVDDLLALARLDQGRPLELGAVDLSEVARDAAEDARAVEPRRDVRADVAAPAVVRADDGKVRQVVANLVRNALVHTPPGTSVTITTGRVDAGSCFVEVADDGPGMTPDVAERAFERFYRADPSRSRSHGGTGLGLAIVDATARAHGGRVTMRTAPGEGTVVRVELPVDPAG